MWYRSTEQHASRACPVSRLGDERAGTAARSLAQVRNRQARSPARKTYGCNQTWIHNSSKRRQLSDSQRRFSRAGLRGMSFLQHSFSRSGTVAAFPTSRPVPRSQMSDLQHSFLLEGTVAAFPTSSRQIPARMSDLQHSFGSAETVAAFPTSSEALIHKPAVRNGFEDLALRKPAGCNSFLSLSQTNPQVAAVFGLKTSPKLQKIAGLWKSASKSCGSVEGHVDLTHTLGFCRLHGSCRNLHATRDHDNPLDREPCTS